MVELLQCCVCGQYPEIDFSACAEIHGTAWQSGYVECSNPKCYNSVGIEFDSDFKSELSREDILKTAWNGINKGV